MKSLYTIVFVLLAGFALLRISLGIWHDAAKEAEQDIRSGHIKFYWTGSFGAGLIGVLMKLAKKYPTADAGVGCVTNDITLRERQEEYARRYNAKIYAYITQKH